jgi:hypothetical protein
MAELMPPLVQHAVSHDMRLARVAVREHTESTDVVALGARHELEGHDALTLSLMRIAFAMT